ncbi:MAG: hypothetical protein JWM33_771, partial [Caulobacteraceae bacterium]|nr:hypothetical protein [Caulobacteraceae bacterium]
MGGAKPLRPPAFILFAGLLLAAAAPAPSGPDALPAQVAGVIGSGDQLSLQLRASDTAPARMVRLGDEAIDGWTLTGLTNTVATLSKDGQSRTIGLNPTGALSQRQPVGPPSTVHVTVEGLTPEMAAVLALSDEEVLAQAPASFLQAYQTATAGHGLTAEELRRAQLYSMRFNLMSAAISQASQARVQAARAQGINSGGAIGPQQIGALLFGQDYIDLVGKQQQFDYQQDLQHYQAAVADGLGMVWVPTGQMLTAYPGGMVEAGYSSQGSLFVVQPPAQPTPIDQPYRPVQVPTLSAQTLTALTGPDGAPADPAAQAAALAAHQQ